MPDPAFRVFRANGHDLWASSTHRYWRTPTDALLVEGQWYAYQWQPDPTARRGERMTVITEGHATEHAARAQAQRNAR